MPAEKPKVVILCGGRGTRLRERTQSVPKPLVEIGGRPILWHVIQIYLAQGFSDFLLLTGYMAEQIERFAAEERWPAPTRVRCLFTGVDTPTGGRLKLAGTELADERFCVTYADGVADIDLDALLSQHVRTGASATVTVVRPELPFGVAELNSDGLVQGFVEKPRSEHWINGGFFCFEPTLLDLLHDEAILEREPLEQLAAGGRLRAYRHEGFWDCMDTFKDELMLNDLWMAGEAPWKLWN
ncbi:sugar phosphate nucleotidyltransferase [Conexibacter sp. DBS9H8]|uniref:sugar phosphate nucleotidyltransferase n=1 Tax=Conexibacter sp. DBS9H8 TaxID=2937801 RepID=UPI00200C02C1|nr:sugar phosphate nucleotidyltransferase [Conexibacter sp. DBS9H8]